MPKKDNCIKKENGNYNLNNKLNDLTGKEWIKFTKTWFIHHPTWRDKNKILHPASYPESLVEEFIKFFTKKGDWVGDPFLGSGSTLLACKNLSRNGVGVELLKKYADISKKRLAQETLVKNSDHIVICGNSKKFSELVKNKGIDKLDFVITSPPYWNQLKRNSLRQKDRKENGLDTQYSYDKEDIGNTDDYNAFLNEQKMIFDEVYKLMKIGGYLVIITNNVFANGRMYSLAFDTAISLSDKWVPKDEKIWCQDDKALAPLGINNAWVGNRHHQYCLIFRKESDLQD